MQIVKSTAETAYTDVFRIIGNDVSLLGQVFIALLYSSASFYFYSVQSSQASSKIFKVMFCGFNLTWASCPSAGRISLDLIQI